MIDKKPKNSVRFYTSPDLLGTVFFLVGIVMFIGAVMKLFGAAMSKLKKKDIPALKPVLITLAISLPLLFYGPIKAKTTGKIYEKYYTSASGEGCFTSCKASWLGDKCQGETCLTRFIKADTSPKTNSLPTLKTPEDTPPVETEAE